MALIAICWPFARRPSTIRPSTPAARRSKICSIAHLKLSQYLKDQRHALTDNERFGVFLTNTLEPVEPQSNFLLPGISAEVKAAQSVKEQPIFVIMGNPPYSGHSK